LMVVVQGQTQEEWVTEAVKWIHDDRVDVIGIPYDIKFEVMGAKNFPPTEFHESNFWGGRRFNLVQTVLYEISRLESEKKIHLLGVSTLHELDMYKQSGLEKHIRSNDTTAPFAAALDGYVWERGQSGPKVWRSLDFDVES